MTPLPSSDVLEHLVDVHCHPTDQLNTKSLYEAMEILPIRICAMATRRDDQHRVADLAQKFPEKVIPCFGYHPWFYHEISLINPAPSKEQHYQNLFLSSSGSASHSEALDKLLPALPDPISLEDIIEEVKSNLLLFPNALMGEVGLDRTFRLAFQPYPSPPPRKLTPFSTPIAHQIAILERQLDLAVELRRSVSLHSVGSQQATVDLLQRMKERYGAAFSQISIDLHSCGLSPEVWRAIEKNHNNIFLSLSTAINSRSDNHEHLIRNCSENRLLVESDYPEADQCTPKTWQMVQTIARLRGWSIESTWDEIPPSRSEWGVFRRLESNWNTFIKGKHPEVAAQKSRRLRRQHQNYPSDESEIE